MVTQENPVLVVGAGPVGLSAAIALRSVGLPVAVLEADDEDRARPGSRALFVHRESLRLLDSGAPGLAAELTGFGVVWHTKRTLYRGREVFAKTYPKPAADAEPPFTSLRQVDTERFLRKTCEQVGASVYWGARVERVRVDPTGVDVVTADGRTFSGSHVVAADGARSTVRRAAGITMSGGRSEGFHTTVDIADPDFPHERLFHYHHPALGGRHVMTVPFAGGFQIDVQCAPQDTEAEFSAPEAVRRWLPNVVDRRHLENILWISSYRFNQVIADRFADPHGRVLLAGEAAHLFPPLGARGMNSGIADAFDAADAIALARSANNPIREAAAIAGYAERRRAAALRNNAAVSEALAHLRPQRWHASARQRAAAALSPVVPRFGTWLENATYGPRTAPQRSGRY
ncbi:3-(3-hydroxy-phenyl)propionate hydroxylase [Actinokineospora baliensis]|uniref:FAD-dependent monooxygenase n=1 Tax=Actinokineospora baliensis TaxID=547056 RepID=UPI0027DB5677|nr:FAD-dependent monooxygenase [Actinokineospora baliensis]MBM7773148.1 3-(3-hydroxy-phenyl)propionate hydroxylase [Actinokineospora baliensis]